MPNLPAAYWRGFLAGEGCFSVSLCRGRSLRRTLRASINCRNLHLLTGLSKYFGERGAIRAMRVWNSSSVYEWRTGSLKVNREVVLPK